MTVRAAITYIDLPEWPPIGIDFGDDSSPLTVAPTPLPPGAIPRPPVRRGSPVLVTSHTYAVGHEGLYDVRLYVAGKLVAT